VYVFNVDNVVSELCLCKSCGVFMLIRSRSGSHERRSSRRRSGRLSSPQRTRDRSMDRERTPRRRNMR